MAVDEEQHQGKISYESTSHLLQHVPRPDGAKSEKSSSIINSFPLSLQHPLYLAEKSLSLSHPEPTLQRRRSSVRRHRFGTVQVLGVQSEPCSFSERQFLEDDDSILASDEDKLSLTPLNLPVDKTTGIQQSTQPFHRSHQIQQLMKVSDKDAKSAPISGNYFIWRTQTSRTGNQRKMNQTMSSLYKQATVSNASAASAFATSSILLPDTSHYQFVQNSTVENALEFVLRQQQPNVPPPSVAETYDSIRFAHSKSLSSVYESSRNFTRDKGCWQQNFTSNKAPTLLSMSSEYHLGMSSEENQTTASDSPPLFSRTESANSMHTMHADHAGNSATDQMGLYERTLYLLTNDPGHQKEIALGKRVGFYRLGKELGAGNFSKVKLGVHVLTKEKVAIKVMEKSKMDQKAQHLFAREIENMELMHHPNIIRLFEVVTTLSKVFLIMEYSGCGELYTYIHEKGKLSEDIAKPIFAQVVSAVMHMHSKELAHRDIKAENIFFSQPGWVKLGDFGFSCKFDSNKLLNTFCGSPPYAAPELFKDQSYSGAMVDIWASGVLLYFMLVGVTPFRGETVQQLKENILQGSYTTPDYVSAFAQHMISRMLEQDVSKRANILEIKRMYWLRENRFPDSYVNLSLNPNEQKKEHCEIEKTVWDTLHSYGITHEMIRESQGKGARNTICGTYRIVLYRCQAKNLDEERIKLLNDHMEKLADRSAGKVNYSKSKACAIL